MAAVTGFNYVPWIPLSNSVSHGTGGNGQFDIFQDNYVTLIVANAIPWDLDSGRITTLQGFQTLYAAAYAIWKDPNNRTHAQVVAYEKAFKNYVKAIREFNRANVKYNPNITEGELASLGVNTNDLHVQPTPMVDMPWGTQLQVFPLGSGAVKFVFRNFNISDPSVVSKGKARGVAYFRVNFSLGDIVPPGPSQTNLVLTQTRAIAIVTFPSVYIGQPIYCFGTSVGRTNLVGVYTTMQTIYIA